jgi:hypothetical protein
MFVDFDLDLLHQLIHIIDQHLELMAQEAVEADDPDSFGYFDRMEHLTGLGFVACQTYMASICGSLRIEKQKALAIGPVHSSGQTKAQIINSAANYWKHNSEWILEKSDRQRKRIEETFDLVGFPINTDYPLSGVLTELAFPELAAFQPIVATLEAWRDELQNKAA